MCTAFRVSPYSSAEGYYLFRAKKSVVRGESHHYQTPVLFSSIGAMVHEDVATILCFLHWPALRGVLEKIFGVGNVDGDM